YADFCGEPYCRLGCARYRTTGRQSPDPTARRIRRSRLPGEVRSDSAAVNSSLQNANAPPRRRGILLAGDHAQASTGTRKYESIARIRDSRFRTGFVPSYLAAQFIWFIRSLG